MGNAEVLTEKAITLLEKLVAFDSVSRHSNLPVIAFIENYLSEYEVSYKRIPSPDGKKSNLLARLGPDVEGGIILSGHTDVVPVDGQEWDSAPFTLTRRRSKLYGRGTADMKSFIAICLAMTPEFLKLKLKKPVWLAFSYDEEIGCLGAPHLLDYIVKHIPKPAFAIIGEPTEMQVVTAHKGVLSFETVAHGLEGHSSQPQLGVNAVHVACDLVHFLNSLSPWERARVRDSQLALPSPGATRHPLPEGEEIMCDERFNPPYSTVQVGTIQGGTARNIIPRQCSFQWEIRPLPGENTDALIKRFDNHCRQLRKKIKAVSAQADIITRPMSHMAGVTLPPAANIHCRTVMHCAQTNQEHAVSFGTEAGVFNDHGVPAIVCGPGSIEQAHKPNEFIELAQIKKCVEFMVRLSEEMSNAK